MRMLCLCGVFTMTLSCVSMQPVDTSITMHELSESPELNFMQTQLWAKTVVNCIEKRNTPQLELLLEHPPVTRSHYPLNTKIITEIQAHRTDQLEAVRTCSSKKVWNKLCAVFVDMGIPLTAFGIGLAEGIISGNKAIIALTSVYFILCLKSAFKDSYAHWRMKNYNDKIEEFDVWLAIINNLEKLNNRNEAQSVHQDPLESLI